MPDVKTCVHIDELHVVTLSFSEWPTKRTYCGDCGRYVCEVCWAEELRRTYMNCTSYHCYACCDT